MSSRYIKKVLAGLEDLLLGPQTVEQVRGESTVEIQGVAMTITVSHLKQIKHVPFIDGQVYLIGGRFNGSAVASFYKYRANENKSNHNATTIIDPNRVAAWDGSVNDLGTLNHASSSGIGCLVYLPIGSPS